MQEPHDYIGWILAGLASAIATLASAVAAMWKIAESKNKRDIDELKLDRDIRRKEMEAMRADVEECRKDREELRIMCVKMEERLSSIDRASAATNQKLDRIEHRHEDEDKE